MSCQPTSRDARLDDTIGENEGGRCNDPLTPPRVSRIVIDRGEGPRMMACQPHIPGAGFAGGSIAAEAMPLTQDSRLRSWPWTLGAVAFGLLLVVVAPPLVLILLVALG